MDKQVKQLVSQVWPKTAQSLQLQLGPPPVAPLGVVPNGVSGPHPAHSNTNVFCCCDATEIHYSPNPLGNGPVLFLLLSKFLLYAKCLESRHFQFCNKTIGKYKYKLFNHTLGKITCYTDFKHSYLLDKWRRKVNKMLAKVFQKQKWLALAAVSQLRISQKTWMCKPTSTNAKHTSLFHKHKRKGIKTWSGYWLHLPRTYDWVLPKYESYRWSPELRQARAFRKRPS